MSIQAKVGWRSFVANNQTGIDTDAQAFITAASITDSTQQSAINTLVTQLKTYGIWTKLKAVYPFVGGTASSHKFNLKDPRDLDAAFRLTFNGGWAHSSTGAKPNGTTGWATTYFNPVTQLTTPSSNHLATYLRTNIDESTVDMGSFAGYVGLGYDIESRYSNVLYSFNGIQNDYVSFANTDSRGLFINTRTSNNVHKILINGVVRGTNTNNFLGFPNTNIALATRYNVSTGLPQTYSSKEQAFASIGDGLSDTEAANFYTAVQTFQTTLGRQVGVPIVADTDAQAFLNAASITDSTQASAVNTLVTQLKTYGIWTKLKAVYPFVGGTAEQHRFNLKNTANYKLTFGGGWAHSSTGALSNGTTGFADTQLHPSLVLSVNDAHTSIYVNNNPVAYTSYPGFGCTDVTDTTKTFYTLLSLSNNYNSFIGDEKGSATYGVTYNNSDSKGFYLASRTSSTMLKGYKNNLLKATTTIQNTGTLPSQNYYYGASNNGTAGLLSLTYNNYSHAFASIGDGLSDTEAANFYTAVEAFQTTLGRNVNTPIVADSDAQAFLNAALITSQTQASAITTLVTDLKSANIWTKMKAIYPFVGGTANSHKFNLKDPRDLDAAYRIFWAGGVIHSSNGVQFGGVNGYADTRLNANSSMSINDFHISVYSRTNTAVLTYEFGVGNTATERLGLGLSWLSQLPEASAFSLVKNTIPNSGNRTDKYFILNKTSSGSFDLFANTSKTTNTITTATKPNLNLWIGAFNYQNTGYYYTDKSIAFSSVGDGLTDAEATAFYTAVQKYQTSLGRQV